MVFLNNKILVFDTLLKNKIWIKARSPQMGTCNIVSKNAGHAVIGALVPGVSMPNGALSRPVKVPL